MSIVSAIPDPIPALGPVARAARTHAIAACGQRSMMCTPSAALANARGRRYVSGSPSAYAATIVHR